MKTKLLKRIRKRAKRIYKIKNIETENSNHCRFDYRMYYCSGKTGWEICSICSSDIENELIKFKKETLSAIERGLLFTCKKKFPYNTYGSRYKKIKKMLEI